jgi:hypothetical protein
MEEPDFYSLRTIEFELKLRSKDKTAIFFSTQKILNRLGDGVAVALIKILDDKELTNPRTVQGFLPIIREGFAQPKLISRGEDLTPKITLLLLNHLRQNVIDAETQNEIQEGVEFIRRQTRNGQTEATRRTPKSFQVSSPA